MSETKTPREFWIADSGIDGLPLLVTQNWPAKYAHQYIHVREVIPGTVTISRGEFRAKWAALQWQPMSNKSPDILHGIETALFGEGE